MPKLHEFEVRAIRLRHADGETVRALAREYRVSSGTVQKIVSRRMWADLPDFDPEAPEVEPTVEQAIEQAVDAAVEHARTLSEVDPFDTAAIIAVDAHPDPSSNGSGVCSIVENGRPCGRAAVAQGLCSSHYYRKRRYNDPTFTRIRTPEAQLDENIARCSVLTDGVRCAYPAHSYGWCQAHWRRWQEHGDVQADQPVTRRSEPPGRCKHPEHGGEAPYVYALDYCKMHYRRDQRARQRQKAAVAVE